MTSNYSAFAPGDFTWIDICPDYKPMGWSKESDIQMFTPAYQAVDSVPGGWDFLKNDEPGDGGFMYGKCKDTETQSKIEAAILQRDGGHSGASFGLTVRVMQLIAKKGWEAFIRRSWPSYNPAPAGTPPSSNILSEFDTFIQNIEKDSVARATIPDFEEQLNGLKQFSKGEISYFEMRSRYG